MSERSYQCLTCQDGGVAVIFNPIFVREFRAAWHQEQADGTPPNGLHLRILKFWKDHPYYPTAGALNHAALCACSCRRRNVLAEELRKYRAGERKDRQGFNRPPGCGPMEWKRTDAPAWPGPVDGAIAEVLGEFYGGRLF